MTVRDILLTAAGIGTGNFRSYAKGAPDHTTVNAVNIDKPSGAIQGDVLIAALVNSSTGNSISAPAGWTERWQGSFMPIYGYQAAIFTKVAGSSEPGYYTFTTTEGYFSGFISAYKDLTDFDTIGTEAEGTGYSVTANSINPSTTAIVLHLTIDRDDGDTNYTPPSGFTERIDVDGGNYFSWHLSDKEFPSGATGDITATSSYIQYRWGTWLIAIK